MRYLNTLVFAVCFYSINAADYNIDQPLKSEEIKTESIGIDHDCISMILSMLSGSDLALNYISRHILLHPNIYDKIVESYLHKNKIFYIEELDIANVIQNNFKVGRGRDLSTEKFHEEITKAFKRYIQKYPYAKLCEYIKTIDIPSFARNLELFLAYTSESLSMCSFNNSPRGRSINATNFFSTVELNNNQKIGLVKNLEKERLVLENLYIILDKLYKDNSKGLKVFNKIKSKIVNFIVRPDLLNLTIIDIVTSKIFHLRTIGFAILIYICVYELRSFLQVFSFYRSKDIGKDIFILNNPGKAAVLWFCGMFFLTVLANEFHKLLGKSYQRDIFRPIGQAKLVLNEICIDINLLIREIEKRIVR